jgi:two-component system OmpR family sensor kinase
VRGVSRMPLRVRLVATMVVLVVLALAAVGGTSVVLVRRHLLHGVDDQLVTVAGDTVRSVVGAGLRSGSTVDRSAVVATGGGAGTLPSQFEVERWDGAGRLVLRRRAPVRADQPGPAVPSDPRWLAAHRGRPGTVAAVSGGGRWRVVSAAVPGGGFVVVGMDLADVTGTVWLLAGVEAAASGLVVLLLSAAGVLIVRSSLRPLVEVERTAAAIAAGDLSRRVPDRDPRTEVGRLGRALNAMLVQLESAFRARSASEDRMRRFVADAGHELRTPVSIISGFLEHYRRRAPTATPPDLDWTVDHVERAATRMARLVEDLLLLARLDADRPLRRDPVDLLAVAGDAVHDARLLAPDRPIALEVATGAAYLVTGDRERLRQVVDNLVGNAVRHTPPGAPVSVRVCGGELDGGPAVVLLEVADEGPGLAPEQAARVFERFYRVNPARPGGTADSARGSGLGLSIVDAVVAAHGGTVSVVSTPGAGATFRVALPLDAGAV